jgi:hypothetical protein
MSVQGYLATAGTGSPGPIQDPEPLPDRPVTEWNLHSARRCAGEFRRLAAVEDFSYAQGTLVRTILKLLVAW